MARYRKSLLDLLETLDFFLQALQLLWMNHVQKNEKNRICRSNVFYNSYSLHFSVGHVSMIASPSEKEVQSFNEVKS